MGVPASSVPVCLPAGPTSRLRVSIGGAVQGVGFRPFVHHLAVDLGLHGWVRNDGEGVTLEAEGPEGVLQEFLRRLETERPTGSFVESLEAVWLDPSGYDGFAIEASRLTGPRSAWIRPDVATCPDCLREVFDPADRRYRYPFTNCTHCGPRFTIIERLPYDRANTSMRPFQMCARCQAEYEHPGCRRFHAQPNACPECGPQLQLWDPEGGVLAARDEALLRAAQLLREGAIVAVKSLGGFHLMVAAGDGDAVRRLRDRKHREEKPFALLFPDLDAVKRLCEVSLPEERLLQAPEAPIVLLRRRAGAAGDPAAAWVADAVAPGQPNLGIMLPSNPLHHLLAHDVGCPLVATSGNRGDEPICIDEREALVRLAGLADQLLVHDRPIVRHADDSLARVIGGRELLLRRARGYVPLPVRVDQGNDREVLLGVGAHLKNAVALAVGPQVFLSQHIGDLETAHALETFRRVAADLPRLYTVSPARLAADLHPDYLSTRHARESGHPVEAVQHHFAHVAAAMAENDLHDTLLGVSWDGTGYGDDGTIWGGEFLLASRTRYRRFAHWRTFPLPGGDAASREPRRAGLGLLFAWRGRAGLAHHDLPSVRAFGSTELAALCTMLGANLNAPQTSSVGRLFDAVASLIGLRQVCRFEGQAAMELEALLTPEAPDEPAYPSALTAHVASRTATPSPTGTTTWILDWAPLLKALLRDRETGLAPERIAARFHNSLVEAILNVAHRALQPRVVLSGGCFQNRYLLEHTVARLRTAGFHPYWPQRVPPNDGGIALGQVVVARARAALARQGQPEGLAV